MATASVDLGKLAAFVAAADGILNGGDSGSLGLNRRITLLRESYDAFQVSGSLSVSNPDLMGYVAGFGEVSGLATHYRDDRLFVEAVRRAFETASGSSSGQVTVSEAAFNTAFATAIGDVARENGIDPAELLLRRAPVTVDDPVAAGVPQSSGFVNDPVCTATGHFLEVEEDFTWPERLAGLRWQRVYSSRFVAEGPFGRGWASWATVGCVRQDNGSVGFQGPDGQLAVFTAEATGLGYQRVSGVAALLAAVPAGNGDGGGGWELVWDWHSAHPGEVWRFDAAGRLQTVSGAAPGTVRFEYEDGRLVGVAHESGRRLAVEWVGSRIVAVRSSCGREARYAYNEAGDLVGSERVLGDRSYQVDGQGLVVEVIDADGVRLCRNTYDDEGRVLVQVSPFGRETVLRYLPGNRTVVSDMDNGPVAIYEHDYSGRLTGLIDHDGHRMERSFDPEGRCVAATGFDGGSFRQGFESDGRSATRVSEDGVDERWHYDDQHRVTGHEVDGGAAMRFDYEGNGPIPSHIAGPEGWEMHIETSDGLLRSLTDADGVTARFDYDRDGNVVGIMNGLGAVTRIEPHLSGEVAKLTTADAVVFEFDRDPAGRLLAVRGPAGEAFRLVWSSAGRMTALVEPNGARTLFEQGSHGEVQRVVDALGGVIELQHDQLARLVGIAAPGGAKWGFEYTAVGLLSMVTDPGGAVWSYDYDAEGRMVSAADPLGHEARQRYNPAGRLVELVDRSGNATRYNHDALGRVVREQDPEGGVTAYAWDALGRPTEVRFPDGDTLTYSYTAAGRVAGVRTTEGRGWANRYDVAGRLVAVTDATGATTGFEWDACDRMTAVVSPSGRVERYRYDALGRVVEVDRAGRRWQTTYDDAGRIVASTDPLGAKTSYQYDLRGKLAAATDPLGNTTRIRYDERGNPTGLVDPFGGVVTTEFDAMRHPIAVTDQLGRTTRVERDAAGRAVRQILPTGDQIEWRHDARGLTTDVRVNGREVIVFERDRTGRPVVIHEPAPNRTLTLSWTRGGRLRQLDVDGSHLAWAYDRDGKLASRRDPSGRTTRYIRDVAGRLVAVVCDSWGRIDLELDPDGQLVGLRGPGIERRWDHDAGGLVAASHLLGVDGEHTTHYVRDAAGRVVEMRSETGVARYRYDSAGQLVAATRGADAWGWHYDPAGRLAVEEGPSGTRRFSYDECHQLVHIDGPQGRTTYSYDAAGRRTEESGPSGTRRFHWDSLGRLAGIETSRGRHRLDVDALGRLAAVDDVALTWDPMAAIPDLVSIGDRQRIGVDGLTLGQASADGTVTWLAGDGHGSTDRGDGRDPWGGRDQAEVAGGRDDPELGYLGEVELDGLVWLRRRVYDPATRQFLSPDPLPGVPGLAVAVNPYTYAHNDPVGFVDPLGLQGQPLSVDQYNELRAQETGWQWNNIVTIGLVVVGVAAMFIPGVGLAGMMLIGAALGAAGGAAPGIIQGIQTGNWDLAAIGGGALRGAVIGAAAGPIGRGAGALGSRFGVGLTGRFGTSLLTTGSRTSTALYGGVMGAGTGAATGTLGELYDLTPLPGSDGQFDPEGIAVSTAMGAGTGAGGAAALYRPHPAAVAATDQINLAQSQSPRPGAAGALVTPDGQVFPASSVKGGTPPAHNPQVQQVLDNIPPGSRGPAHGRCVEPQAVSNALDAGVDPRGGVASTGQVRAPGNPKHGNALPPCSSCQQLLDHYGIDWLPPGG